MNISSSPESSLYQLTQTFNPTPQSLRVNLLTLESVVGAVLDFLSEQKFSPIVWVKLPNTDNWLVRFQQYQQRAKTQKIYWCTHRGETLPSSYSNVTPLVLEASANLKREFFIVILSPQFCTLILFNKISESDWQSIEVSEREFPDFGLVYSFNPSVIKIVLEKVKQKITITDETPSELLNDSEIYCDLPQSLSSYLLESLLLKQIQQIEFIQSDLNIFSQSKITIKNLRKSLEFKDHILKNFAQELSLPVTNMRTGLRLLESMQSKREQRQRYLQLLQRECERQASILSGLQEFVQLDQLSISDIDTSLRLEDLIPGIVSTYQPLAEEKGILLGYTIPAGFPAVCCPEVWLRQIIINLLNNSLKFTPAKGRVFVQASLKQETVEITVTDTGMGIEKNDLPLIFNSFYRGRNATNEGIPGAGLGLTIVKHLLERCGGSISVSSHLRKGTSFTIVLPLLSSVS